MPDPNPNTHLPPVQGVNMLVDVNIKYMDNFNQPDISRTDIALPLVLRTSKLTVALG